MLANIAAAALAEEAPSTEQLRARLSRSWAGLGSQGVEGAMLSMTLSLEAMGCTIISTQTGPEDSEIVVEPFPGTDMLDGLTDRFDLEIDGDGWRELVGIDTEAANRIYDMLGAIADGAGVEYLREELPDGNIRLVLRAW